MNLWKNNYLKKILVTLRTSTWQPPYMTRHNIFILMKENIIT